jgi:hypothetical protein
MNELTGECDTAAPEMFKVKDKEHPANGPKRVKKGPFTSENEGVEKTFKIKKKLLTKMRRSLVSPKREQMPAATDSRVTAAGLTTDRARCF